MMAQKTTVEKKVITAYVPTELLTKAREYGINVSRAASEGIKAAIDREEKLRKLDETVSENNDDDRTYQ